ncbi:MAG: crossover junction endodeoxyribonuclease RuvC [Candidatus Gottesmanbacteria bacterium]|nr:crossover junction endodeoxyribonuclease RuvC [Candidatus Gottesmanbacteria bacterium]
MKIIGIDPGTARVGWALIDVMGSTIRPLSYGCITTPAGQTPETRLLTIHREITKILTKDKPSSLAIEDLFFASNAKTVIPVGQARGVILLAAAEQNIPVASYSPRAVKSTIAGDGRADKTQVLSMVMRILHLDTPPKPDDTADAIAIALTHAYSYKLKGKIT